MAFIPQNDSGTAVDANAYIDVAYFDAYFADRGIDVSEWTDDEKKGAIVVATDYIDTLHSNYSGEILVDTQTTEFPRTAFEGLPTVLKRATAEYALAQLKGGITLESSFEELNKQVSSERSKVGPIEEEITYAQPATLVTVKKLTVADRWLRQLIDNGSLLTFGVYRG